MMMQSDLQDLPLRDIHVPDTVSWWPLAPGWWLLLLLIILIIASASILRRHLRRQRLRKIALATLKSIKAEYRRDGNPQQLVRALSVLLRRICISYLSRAEVAALTGSAWLRCLDSLSCTKTLPQNVFSKGVGRVLADAPYQKNATLDAEILLNLCETWIKTLPPSTASGKSRTAKQQAKAA